MPGFSQLVKTLFSDYKSDGKKLQVLQQKVPELQDAVNFIDDEYKLAIAAEATERKQGDEVAVTDRALIRTELASEATERKQGDDDATADRALIRTELATEKERAEAAEGALQSSIAAEASTRFSQNVAATADRALIRSELNTEKERAEAAEAAISADVASLSADVEAKDSAATSDRALIRTELATERSDREAADTVLQTSIAGERTRAEGEEARIEGKVDAEVLARTAADSNLQTQIDTLSAGQSSDSSAAQAERAGIKYAALGTQNVGDKGDGTLRYFPDSDANYFSSEGSNPDLSLAKHVNQIDREVKLNKDVIGQVNPSGNKLWFGLAAEHPKYMREDTEQKSTIAEDVVGGFKILAGHLETEVDAATADRAAIRTELAASDAVVQAALDTQEAKQASDKAAADADRTAIRTELSEAVATEKTRAEGVEGGLRTDLNTHIALHISDRETADADRQRIETEYAAADAVEKARAEAAEAALGVRIDNILSNADPAAIDSLSEMLNAFQTADGDLQATITNLTTSTAANLAAEVSAREAGDAAHASALSLASTEIYAEIQSKHTESGDNLRKVYEHVDRKEYAYSSQAVLRTGVAKHESAVHVMKWDDNYTPDGPEQGLAGQKRTVRHVGHLFCPEGYKMKVHYDDGSTNKGFEEFEFGQTIDNQFEHTMEFHFDTDGKTSEGMIPFVMADRFKTMGNTMLEMWGRIEGFEFMHTAGDIDGVNLKVHYEFILDGTVENPVDVPYFRMLSREQTIDFHRNKDHTTAYFQ